MFSNMLWMVLFALLFTGLGLLARATAARRSPAFLPDLIAAFWIGWAAALAALQVIHLFLPLSQWVTLLLAIGGLAGWLLASPRLWGFLRQQPAGRIWLAVGMGASLLALLAHQGMYAELHYDHGLYHLPTLRWMQEYPILPGLGNLHHRLAFNNASLLYAAALNAGQTGGPAFNMASLLLMWLVVLRGGMAVLRLVWGSAPRDLSQLFYALSLPAALYFMTYGTLGGYSPDVPVFALQVEIAGQLLAAFQRSSTPEEALPARLGYIVLLAAAGIAVKLSMLVFSLLALLAAVWAWQQRRGIQLRRDRSAVLGALGTLSILLIPWLLRGALLSGYLLYPSALLPLPVPWRIPVDMVTPIARGIHDWALGLQHLPEGASFLQWLRYWQSRVPLPMKLGGLLAGGLLIVAAVKLLAGGRRPLKEGISGLLAVLGLALGGLLYWLLAAPDPRFSGALVWITLIDALLLAGQLFFPAGERSARLAVLGLVGLALLVVAPRYALQTPNSWWLNPPSELHMARIYLPDGAWHTETTRSGLAVYLPQDDFNEACWDAPLPCTRLNDFHPRLALFQPPDLGSGFYLIPDD